MRCSRSPGGALRARSLPTSAARPFPELDHMLVARIERYVEALTLAPPPQDAAASGHVDGATAVLEPERPALPVFPNAVSRGSCAPHAPRSKPLHHRYVLGRVERAEGTRSTPRQAPRQRIGERIQRGVFLPDIEVEVTIHRLQAARRSCPLEGLGHRLESPEGTGPQAGIHVLITRAGVTLPAPPYLSEEGRDGRAAGVQLIPAAVAAVHVLQPERISAPQHILRGQAVPTPQIKSGLFSGRSQSAQEGDRLVDLFAHVEAVIPLHLQVIPFLFLAGTACTHFLPVKRMREGMTPGRASMLRSQSVRRGFTELTAWSAQGMRLMVVAGTGGPAVHTHERERRRDALRAARAGMAARPPVIEITSDP